MYARVAKAPRRLHELDVKLPARLDSLLQRCLDRDPAARPPAADLRGELRELAGVLTTAELVYRTRPSGNGRDVRGGHSERTTAAGS